MCSPQLLGKDLTSTTLGYISVEMECFQAIYFLQLAVKNQHRELLEDSKRGTYKGIEKQPKYVAGTYDLPIKTYRQIGPYKHQSSLFNYHARVSGTSIIILKVK